MEKSWLLFCLPLIYFSKESHSCLFGTVVISKHLLLESEINKKSGNNGRTTHKKKKLK